MIKTIPDLSRVSVFNFWKKVQRADDSECWLWRGALDNHGYGRFTVPISKNKRREFLAHRISFFLHVGQPVFFVCHSCDNPKCVNPKHLFLGSNKDNIFDAAKKGRMAKKLSADKALAIRAMMKCGIPISKISDVFSVSRAVVCDIRSRKLWAHV